MRIFQGVGAAMLMANSAAILTDAFPDNQRGHGARRQPGGRVQRRRSSASSSAGVLAPINWRLIFLVSVPIGLFATVVGYLQAARGRPAHGRPASTGPATSPSPSGLVLVMVGITYGIEPYGDHTMGWTNPW